MTAVSESFELESEESRPPNHAMREAIRFAHWLRAHHDSADTDGGLAYWWRTYEHLDDARNRFTRVIQSTSWMRRRSQDSRRREWETRYRLFMGELDRAFSHEWGDSYHQKRYSWLNANPDPRNFIYHRVIEWCSDCSLPDWEGSWTRTVDGGVCFNCYEQNYHSCGQCGEIVRNDSGHHHPPPPRKGSKCKAPHERFRMPNKLIACGYQPSDRIVHVNGVRAGMVPEPALEKIISMMTDSAPFLRYWNANDFRHWFGSEWETKEGKFPKRVSNKLFKDHQVRLPQDVVTEIGNIARQNMSTTMDNYVEFTRKLDRPAKEFYHGDSCWWTGYSDEHHMRCVLKQNGGMAMRLFRSVHGVQATGRAWVIPLDSNLYSTNDSMDAFAYLLFNAYGEMSSQEMSSLLAMMVGKKYVSHIVNEFEGSGMYINGGSCYLVADNLYGDATVPCLSVRKSDIACTCYTHKRERPQKYEYDDSDFDEAQTGTDTIASAVVEDGEEEEPYGVAV